MNEQGTKEHFYGKQHPKDTCLKIINTSKVANKEMKSMYCLARYIYIANDLQMI